MDDDVRFILEGMQRGMERIEDKVDGIGGTLGELREDVAKTYVTQDEFDQYKKDEYARRYWWAGAVLAIAAIFARLMPWLVGGKGAGN